MQFIFGVIVGGVVVGILMAAACAARHEKRLPTRRYNRDATDTAKPVVNRSQPIRPSTGCRCEGYQDLG